MPRLEIFTLTAVPEVVVGDDLAALIVDALARDGTSLQSRDIVVVAQKIVSKAEGRTRRLVDIEVSPSAEEIAQRSGKDARKVQAILDESSAILRIRRVPPDGLIIARHRHGWVCANAGIDESNLGPRLEGHLLLLPEDPDTSARKIAEGIAQRLGVMPGVLITDTFGRPWRKGLVNVTIGSSGVETIRSWLGRADAYGRKLAATEQAFADEIAAASGLVMAKDAKTPIAVIRGLEWKHTPATNARDYVRPAKEDLFA